MSLTSFPPASRRGAAALLLALLGGLPAAAQRPSAPSRYQAATAPAAVITVQAAQAAGFRVPRSIYGTFLEDIGHSVFGGVSSQLLANPSFENYDASLGTLQREFGGADFQRASALGLPLPWLPLHFEDGVRYEPRWGGAANSSRYLFLMGRPDHEVGIRQAIYLPIERTRVYRGVLFARAEQRPLTLGVSFRRPDAPQVALASATVPVTATAGWQKLRFALTLHAAAVAPLHPVDLVVSVTGDVRVALDDLRLYPDDATDGLDPEVVAAARALHSPVLRYGGNYTSGYHWRDGVGPRDARRTQLNQSWGFPVYNDFGTDELMEFCRRIGSRPQICLNLGSGTPEEARAWVEYCQGGAGTVEGRRRAANGHPAPYPVFAWELGNELWGHFQIGWQTPQGNARRYGEFYAAIHSLVPAATKLFGNGADVDGFHDWNGAILARDGARLQYLTTHFVVGMDDLKVKGQSPDALLAADFAVPVGVGRALDAVADQIDADPATRGRVKLAFTEWLFHAPQGSAVPRYDNLGGALNTAAWMNMLNNHADLVPIADMTGLLEFSGIFKKRGRVFLTPGLEAFSLYSNYAGDTPLITDTRVPMYDVHNGNRRVPEIPGVPYLDVLATRDSGSGDLTLFVVNRDWRAAMPTTIDLRDFQPAPQATVRTLNSASILDRNDEVHPHAVEPLAAGLTVSGRRFPYEFPAHSLTVMTLHRVTP